MYIVVAFLCSCAVDLMHDDLAAAALGASNMPGF